MATHKSSHAELLDVKFRRIHDEELAQLPELFPGWQSDWLPISRWTRFRWWWKGGCARVARWFEWLAS